MTDIVERLRELWADEEVQEAGVDLIMAEAADEIERLREALHTIFCNTEPDAIRHRDYDHLAKNICEVARSALGEKE